MKKTLSILSLLLFVCIGINAQIKVIVKNANGSVDLYPFNESTKITFNDGNVLFNTETSSKEYTPLGIQRMTFGSLASSITISQTSATVMVGENIALTANVEPTTATNKSVSWSSNNTNVATVNENGVVTALSVGTATITVTTTDGSDKTASCVVTVTSNLFNVVYEVEGSPYKTVQYAYRTTIIPEAAPVKDDKTFYYWDGMPEDMIMPDHDITVTAVYALRGDVNLDEKVNVTDAVDIVNDRLGYESANFVNVLSDVNRDEQYTITDAIAVLNIMYGEPVGANAAPKRSQAQEDSLGLSLMSNNTIALDMTCDNGYAAFQFDVELPEGIMLDGVSLNDNRCNGFAVRYNKTDDNIYKVVAYNLANEPLTIGSDNLLTLKLSDANVSGEVRLTNIHFSTQNAVDVLFEDLVSDVTTGIQSHTVSGDDVEYNVSGMRVSKDYRGIVIVNGKKVIRK